MKFLKHEVMALLKHRPPFMFLDQVEIVSDLDIVGHYDLRKQDHSFLTGHFPGNPIMPGVLLQEIVGQLAGIMTFKKELDAGHRSIDAFDCEIFLVTVKDFVYKEPVVPDCRIIVNAHVTPMPMPFFFQARAHVRVDGEIRAKGTLIIYSRNSPKCMGP